MGSCVSVWGHRRHPHVPVPEILNDVSSRHPRPVFLRLERRVLLEGPSPAFPFATGSLARHPLHVHCRRILTLKSDCQRSTGPDRNRVKDLPERVCMAEPAMKQNRSSDSRFEALYRRFHPEILAYFVRRIHRSEAEDATAQVFTVVWRRIDDVPDGDGAVAWLFGVARNVLSNHRRSWRRKLRLRYRLANRRTPESDPPDVVVVRSEEDQILMRALERLSSSDQELLKLATWEKLPYSVIAELLDTSEAAVGQRVSRARKRLKRELERIERTGLLPFHLFTKKES